MEIFKYRNLIKELVIRDIKVKYKKSVLGILWSILNPLLMMMVMTVVFSTIFKSSIPNFPMYLIIGQTLFTFFSETTNMALMSIIYSAGLIKKVYIPKYIFPFSKSLFALSNLFFSLIAVFIVAIFTKIEFSFYILLFPLPIFLLFLFSFGIGLIVATYSVFFRDIGHLYQILLLIWTYVTPIFYPITILPGNLVKTILYNPLFCYITFARDLILERKISDIKLVSLCFLYSLVSMILGMYIFKKNEKQFIFYI
ncbi:Polysialic acid transport protein KpsM [uncultured Leptotrichia sp.]|uniref:ABC transporter permease n=1 Tax=uncultured Leptotrichia sp. TaxID=159271 RepID=UPI001A383D86|nr:ABC transporter permease [uncultured Leptotrichia sp.]VTX49135.1 Polysialic acid transport protein KpsM [uncultured Leptotrichia sp.]